MKDFNKLTVDQNCVDFIFEVGMLANLKRSGNAFLGSGNQSVADHSFRCAVIAHILSQITSLPHDPYKLLSMCLFHDVPEARIGDLNYIQQSYVSIDLESLWKDVEGQSPIGKTVHSLVDEFDNKETNESKLAQDADKLELIFFLKEQHDLGNPRAFEWLLNAEKRLITSEARSLAQEIKERKADEWWKIRSGKPPR